MSKLLTTDTKGIPAAQVEQAAKLIGELRMDLISAFKRLAEANGVKENNIQLGICFKDLATGEGELYYRLFVNWVPIREANFNRDFLGVPGKEAMFPDTTGKEAFIKIYVMGFPPLKIKGVFEKIAEKYSVKKWSTVNGIFYKKKDEDPIKLGIFVVNTHTGKSERVELIDLFDANKQPAEELPPGN